MHGSKFLPTTGALACVPCPKGTYSATTGGPEWGWLLLVVFGYVLDTHLLGVRLVRNHDSGLHTKITPFSYPIVDQDLYLGS